MLVFRFLAGAIGHQFGQLRETSRFTELKGTFSSKVLGPGTDPNMISNLTEATQGQHSPTC